MNRILCLMAMVCIYVNGFGQNKNSRRHTEGKLYLSERLPDFNLGRIINYKDTAARLSSFDGKIIIFDFWFTGCSVCVKQFAKEDSLQQLYNSRIQIIPVTYESENKVRAFLQNWERLHHRQLHMPFIVEDTLLNNLFPDRFFPHFIWLFQRALIAKSTAFFVTAENIEGMIHDPSYAVYNSVPPQRMPHLDSVYLYHPVQN